MLERSVDYYRRLNRHGPAEDSIPFRITVAVSVLLSVFAAVRYGAVGAVVGVPVMLGVVAGSLYSYWSRNRSNLILKLILTVLLITVFVIFWSELTGFLQDLRYPLVRLFLWLQVLHSFDLPTRRDLDFSLVSATILIAFAGSLSMSTEFIFVLIPFFIVALTALYFGHRSGLESRSQVVVGGKGRSSWSAMGLAALAILPLALVLFMALPRLQGFNVNLFPVSEMRGSQQNFRGIIRNPGYKEFPEKFPDRPLPFNPDAYQGFSQFLDMRMRGVPSNRVVMKVRSNRPAYWRATAFDRFLGNGWENTDKKPEEIDGDELPLPIQHSEDTPRYRSNELVQTFFIERRLPNTVFAAYQPRTLFFPTRILKVDSVGTIITPLTLDPGLIYTAISEVSAATPEMLRASQGGAFPTGLRERYTQLPEMSPDVAALAGRITEGIDNQYDKVLALERYLKANYSYDLDVPAQGDEENSVEFFLFKQKKGFCEHFAATLAVMCRSIGIPARVAVGYDTGKLNPLTGYYEVQARDAHAWVEVYFPFYDWITFDPTPGWTGNSAVAENNTWSGFNLLQYIGRGLSRVIPDSWMNAAKSVGRSAGSALGWLANHWWALIAAAALLAAAVWAVRLFKRRRPQATPARAGPGGPRQTAVILFEKMTDALSSLGFSRRESQTPTEYAAEVYGALSLGQAVTAAEAFNRARFAKVEPEEADIDELSRAVSQVEREVQKRKERGHGGPRSG